MFKLYPFLPHSFYFYQAEGIQPAAGPVAKVTPPPAQTPNINFRPNENAAFLREAVVSIRTAPAVSPSAPQLPSVVIVTGGGFSGGDQLP